MRRDLAAIVLIAGAALGIRIYPAWEGVFGGPRVNFLETDAWYHLRLVENQVRNFPFRVTEDPYAAPGGQFVPIAPLYDTLTATAVVAWHGRDADAESVARVAAFLPPLVGALAIVTAWLIARRVFASRAAWLAAALLAVWPGHFMDRTVLGFVDHHALEALLALAVLAALVMAIGEPREADGSAMAATSPRPSLRAAVAGLALGLYLLAWASGALLVAILGAWLLAVVVLARAAPDIVRCAHAIGMAAAVALVLVLAFQHPGMHRYGSQVGGLIGLAAIGFALVGAVGVGSRLSSHVTAGTRRTRLVALATLAGVAIAGGAVTWWLRPDEVSGLVTDVARLAPDPGRMGVLEARPLFSYPGEWNWWQPWQFFRSGFYVGLIALLALGVRVWRERRPDQLLLWVFTASMFAATVGQNRFGYYLMPACALLGGWLADRVLALGEQPPVATAHWRARTIRLLPTIVVAGLMFAPALPSRLLFQPRTGMFVSYWQDALDWIGQHTAPPFAAAGLDDRFYLARYTRPVPMPDYTVMNWWDQGYYLIQRARRVPVSNPTQERAPIAARFYTETDEARALAILGQERGRYVLADWELPFRWTAEGSIAGRFQTLGDWAGVARADYYEVCYRREGRDWAPVWLFYEPYYRSMAYRLVVLGGSAATPSNATTVVTLSERREANGGVFCEVVADRTFATYDAARAFVMAAPASDATVRLAGLDPWQTAFPLPPLTSLREVHAVRTPEQKPGEGPWVRIFVVE